MKSREHWERVHRHTAPAELSWFQRAPTVSLDLIRRVAPDLDAPIIDVGGGASTLVDGLLDAGYRNVTVLDISDAALDVARTRLGARATQVRWLEADVRAVPLASSPYDVWHDRAVFHFLTDPRDRAAYVDSLRSAVRPGGHVIVASFALDGPTRCSGLPVVRYSCESMQHELGESFRQIESVRETHHTPSGATQAFVYCLWRLSE
jgi:2-polyprenyl-3-methyl-5-hydroxy-6-metoxy-1,4-benzoquinol methylase